MTTEILLHHQSSMSLATCQVDTLPAEFFRAAVELSLIHIFLSSVRQLCIAAGLAVELPEVTLTAPSRTAASAVLRRREKER